MKKCKYCGLKSENSVSICPSCGSGDFSYICDNCGNLITSGKFCTNCGVKIGKDEKICPKCGERYFSNACPNCGYLPYNQDPVNDGNYYEGNSGGSAAGKKKVGFGTILLWIFFPPVMATVAIWKSQKMQLWLKIVLTAILWLFIMGVYASDSEESGGSGSKNLRSDSEAFAVTQATDVSV